MSKYDELKARRESMGIGRYKVHRLLDDAIAAVGELELELRSWKCDTFEGRCYGCPDCQAIPKPTDGSL